jgi:4-amino-4-deoxy-L-arabinose transferase-like glycosyltransferase
MRRIIGLLFLCLIVGLVLSWMGATPSTLGVWIADMAENGWENLQNFASWGGGYILMGAMVILPIMALRWLFKRRKGG